MNLISDKEKNLIRDYVKNCDISDSCDENKESYYDLVSEDEKNITEYNPNSVSELIQEVQYYGEGDNYGLIKMLSVIAFSHVPTQEALQETNNLPEHIYVF